MTAHSPRILTEGESSLLDAFSKAGFSDNLDVRKSAMEAIETNGLPTRRIEAFHYTDLRALLKGGYQPAPRPADDVARSAGEAFPRLVDGAAVLHFRDGHYFDQGETLPEGVSMETASIVPGAVDTSVDNAVELINTAFLQDTVSLSVAEGANVAQTVGLAHAQTGAENTLSANRTRIVAAAGSTSNFVNRACGRDGVPYLS